MKRALLMLVLCGTASAAPDLADYDPHSTAWNGMAQFVALAEGMGFEVTPVSELEWSDLGAKDILFLVYPLRRVDPNRLTSFVQAGGNVVIADDFGEGKDAMTGLGLLRAESRIPKASRYYEGRLWAPIATAQSDHPVAREVGEVVTNHPAALDHVEGATAVVGFDQGALVVAGDRGTGRFVAVSDPSIFINRMQQDPFHGNVALTVNILNWLSRDGNARHIVLLRGDVAMYGDPQPFIDDPRGGKLGRSIAEVNSWLWSRHEWLLTASAMKAVAHAASRWNGLGDGRPPRPALALSQRGLVRRAGVAGLSAPDCRAADAQGGRVAGPGSLGVRASVLLRLLRRRTLC